MTVRPILFSGPMVRALLAGRKTQTRRLLRPQPPIGTSCIEESEKYRGEWVPWKDGYPHHSIVVPYSAGDILYVREAWRAWWEYNDLAPAQIPTGADIQYSADQPLSPWNTRARSSLHMPRWASRLTLEVTGVNVERLQAISESDARAEGVLYVPGHGEITPGDLHEGYSNYLDCRTGFEVLWDSLNAKRASWASNPWVAAIAFTVHKCNVDHFVKANKMVPA